MIDPQGYLTLIDLMHLEELPQDQASVNTPSKATFFYLSPEVLTSQGHSFETDFWSLGVVIYRMIVGEFPYGQKASEDEDIMLDDLSS